MAKFLNKNVKYLRNKKGISQQTLANKIGIDRSTISRIESNEIETTVDNALKIAEYFNIYIKDLTGKDLTKETGNKTNDDLQSLLDAYQGLSDSDKEFMKNMIIERRKQIDKQLEKKDNNT